MNRWCLLISLLSWLLCACVPRATTAPTTIATPRARTLTTAAATPTASATSRAQMATVMTLPAGGTPSPTPDRQAPSAASSLDRYDPQRSGRSAYPAPEQPWLKWLNQDFLLAASGFPTLSPAAACPDGTTYATSSEGTLWAVDARGHTKWNLDLGASWDYAPAIAADGTIYLGSEDGHLYAVTPAGSKMWQFAAESAIISSPLIDPRGNVYFAAKDAGLYSLSPGGSLNWRFVLQLKDERLALGPQGALAMSLDGTVYYALGYQLLAIEPHGELKWMLDFTLADPTSFPAVSTDGTIYAGGGNRLCAISPGGKQTWCFAAEDRVVGAPAIGLDGTIYFSSTGGLYALTPDGSLKWRFALQEHGVGSPSVDSGGNICFPTSNRLYLVGPDGDLKWSYERRDADPPGAWLRMSGRVPGPLTIGPDRTIYVAGERGLLAVSSVPEAVLSRPAEPAQQASWPQFQQNAQHTGRYPYAGMLSQFEDIEPRVKWSYLGSPGEAPVIAADGSLYFKTRGDREIVALSQEGNLKWSLAPERGEIVSSLALGEDGTIYFGSWSDSGMVLSALNSDGSLEWRTEVGAIHAPPSIAPDGTIYCLGEGILSAVDPEDGILKWQLVKADTAWRSFLSSPAIAPDGTAYFDSEREDGSWLHAVNADGTVKWELALPDYGVVTGPPAIAPDGTIYVGTAAPERLLAISPEGAIRWQSDVGPVQKESVFPVSVAIGTDGALYFGASLFVGPHLCALTPEGDVKWRSLSGWPGGVSAPAVMGSDGTVYFGTRWADARVYALREDGSLRWEFSAHGTVYGLAIGPDGTIYVASEDGNLYAISSVPTH